MQPCPSPKSGPVELFGVAALSARNAWAVRTWAGASKTLIEHWNGRKWSKQPSPSPGGFASQLLSVTAVSATNVWAAGTETADGGAMSTLVEHRNGHRWSVQPSASDGTTWNSLNAITALSGSSVWAVGNADMRKHNGTQTLVERWNGKVWRVQPSASPALIRLSLPDVRLLGAAAVSGKNAWTVGFSGDWNSGAAKTLIEHWNGRAWQVQHSPSPDGSSGRCSTASRRGCARIRAE